MTPKDLVRCILKDDASGSAEVVVMDARHVCENLQRNLGALFTCSAHGDYQRIRTPYLYPDGDVIDLFCKVDGDTGDGQRSRRDHPAGFTRSRRPCDGRRSRSGSSKTRAWTHGLEFYRGTLQARCRRGDDLAAVVTRVAQGALRVSDLWFTIRTQAVESITDEVADFLTERELGFDRDEKLAGRSGRGWTVDFHVRTERRSSLVQVLSTGNRAAAHRVSEHVLAGWHDLNHLVLGPEGPELRLAVRRYGRRPGGMRTSGWWSRCPVCHAGRGRTSSLRS